MVSLDLEKAYDTVWIHGLLYKLITLNPLNAELNTICHLLALLGAHPILHVSRIRVKLPKYLIFTLRAFLVGRSFTVRLNNAASTPKNIPSGLPQGGVLSTALFVIYISDMPHPPNTQLALYADDTAFLTQSWRTDTIARRLTP